METALVTVPARQHRQRCELDLQLDDRALNYLAEGQTLTLTYTVKVNDHSGDIVTQTMTITISGTDNTPVITAATAIRSQELPATNNETTTR